MTSEPVVFAETVLQTGGYQVPVGYTPDLPPTGVVLIGAAAADKKTDWSAFASRRLLMDDYRAVFEETVLKMRANKLDGCVLPWSRPLEELFNSYGYTVSVGSHGDLYVGVWKERTK